MALPELSVRRSLSADAINVVVNHPEVRPWLGGEGELDLSAIVANPDNYLLMAEGGGFLLTQQEPGIYEVHSQFLPEARGPGVIRAAKDASRYMFTRTDCVEIRTKVPQGNVGAAALARRMGWDLQFTRHGIWPKGDGMVGIDFYAKSITQWANWASELEATGAWFHDKLEAAKIEKGATTPIHDDDPVHDRYVGATVEMMAAGQVLKALAFYGRWAAFAGYGPIALIATDPPVIDIGDAILAVRGDDFDVLLVR